MRKLISKGFILEFVSLLALIFTIALAWAGNLLKLPTEAVVVAGVGIAVAAYVWALKWELKREIQDKLSIYTLLEKIEDDELYKRGLTAIERCRVELENLAKGILQLESGQLFRYLIQVSETAKLHIRLTHIGLDDKYFEILQTAGEQQWYQQNVDLVRKGVKLERFFILSRSTAVVSGSNQLKAKIRELLERQQNDGINVRVVWQEELDNAELIQDFGVFDNRVVLVTHPAWTTGYNNVLVYRRQFDIERYIEIYEVLRSKSHSISESSTN